MSFDICMNRLLDLEKGYKPASPDDPGGETNWGIAKRWHPTLDIKNLTREQAIELYRTYEWAGIKGDQLPMAIAWQLLDYAVNSGVVPAIKALQGALGVKEDGILGPATIAAANAVQGAALAGICMKAIAARLDYIDNLKNWLPNSVGWSERIVKNLRYAAEDCSV